MAEYDTKEKVAALGTIEVYNKELTRFIQYIRVHNLGEALATGDFSKLPGLEGAGAAGVNMGETVDVPMRDGYKNPLRVFKTTSGKTEKVPLVVMIFGGGFVMGDNTQFGPVARPVDKLYNATVVLPSYRLAPAHPFPKAYEDVLDNLHWIVANAGSLGADPSAGFVVGGGSAGANLAAVATQAWLEARTAPPITGLFLNIPFVLDAEIVPEKYKALYFAREQNADAYVLNATSMAGIMAAYAPDVRSPAFSPFNAKNAHKGMPPTYFGVCGMDPLRDDGLIYEKALRENGVKTKIDVYPGVPHAHAMFQGLKPAQRANYDSIKAIGWLLGVETTDEEVDKVMPGGNLAAA